MQWTFSCDEFFSHIGRSINSLVLKHRCDLDRKRLIIAVQRLLKERGLYLGEVTGKFDAATGAAVEQYEMVDKTLYSELVDSLRTATSDSEYKTRWVDQTPQILPPYLWSAQAVSMRFIIAHRARRRFSCTSMLNFHRIAGSRTGEYRTKKKYTNLAAHGQSMFRRQRKLMVRTWLIACAIRLSREPRSRLCACHSIFWTEPYSAKCLEPLSERINSSNVPPDFKTDDPATDPAIVEEARADSARVEQTSQPTERSHCRSRRVGGRVRPHE